MRTIQVMQMCHSCGAHFILEYCENGTYNYIDYCDYPCDCADYDVFDCDSDFSPAFGEPSISEWIESLTS